MKWFLFFILVFFVLSCQNHNKQAAPIGSGSQTEKKVDSIAIKKMIDSIAEYELPEYTEDHSGYFRDSGYFKGPLVKAINYNEKPDSGMLSDFLTKNLSRKDIIYLSKNTLSHSVLIDKKKKLRLDTLKSEEVIIISKYLFGDKKSQTISINGTNVRIYKETGVDTLREDIWDFGEWSFRRFFFKGKEFYFFVASIMDCGAMPGCLFSYHFLYDVKNKKLNQFVDFRINELYFFGDVDGDEQLDYIQIDNEGGYGMIGDSLNRFRIGINSCNKSGNFEILKDAEKREYYIEGNSGTNYYVAEEMYIDKYYWPVKLK